MPSPPQIILLNNPNRRRCASHPVVDIGVVDTIFATDSEVINNVEYLSTSGDRSEAHSGPNIPGDIDFRQPHMSQRNGSVHDCANGAHTKTAVGGEINGTHFYNMGWFTSTPPGQGQAMYEQHDSDESRTYTGIIVGQTFAFGLHAYAETAGVVRNMHFDHCIFFDCGFLVGGQSACNVTFDHCVWFRCTTIQLGFVTANDIIHHDLTITNGYAYNSTVWARNVDGLVITDSTLISDSSPMRYDDLIRLNTTPAHVFPTTMQRNHYGGANFFRAGGYYTGGKTFDQFQLLTGFDSDSDFTLGNPTVNVSFVFPSTYAPKIAHIAVFNWQQLNTVTVDISSLGLIGGAYYCLRNAYNPNREVVTFQYNRSGQIVLPMGNRSVVAPIGWDAPLAAIDPRFGAWLLEAAA